MESKVKFLGHAVHEQLIPFPFGLLVTSVIFDVLYLITGNGELANVAWWMIAAGIVGGVLASPFGWIDWFAITKGTRAKKVGLAHGFGNSIMAVGLRCGVVAALGLSDGTWRTSPHAFLPRISARYRYRLAWRRTR